MRYQLSLLSSLLVFSLTAQEPETQPEQPKPEPYQPMPQDIVIGEQFEQLLPAAEIQWLGDGDTRFLVRSKPDQTGQALGNIVIVSGPGKTIDNAGYVRRALEYFPTVSWNVTVVPAGDLDFTGPDIAIPETSLTNEVTTEESSAKAADSASNIPSKPEPTLIPAEQWYAEQQENNLEALNRRVNLALRNLPEPEKNYVLISASSSAGLLVTAVASGQLTPSAIVLVDIQHPVISKRAQMMSDIASLTMPVLDLYQPLQRKQAELRAPNSRITTYRQTMIPAVNSDYVGVEDLLLRTIRGWLRKQIKQ